MKKTFSAVIICLSSINVFAQTKTIDVDKVDANATTSFYAVSGEPFVNTKFVRLTEGSPYFKDEWMRGSLLLEKNKQYKGLLKLDLYSNEVHYQDAKGNDFVVTLPLKKILLSEDTSVYTFFHFSVLPASEAKRKADWYLQLYADTVSLYKYFVKQLSENRPYNSATYEQKISTSESYRIYYKGAAVDIKKIKDAPALFGEKKTSLEEFLKTTDNKKAPLDDRMIALATYLNSLVRSSN